MSQFITLPNGDAVSNAVIKGVRYVKGRGVVCTDAQQRIAVWIDVPDEVKGNKVRNIMYEFAKNARGIPQPDWTFLNDEAVTAS